MPLILLFVFALLLFFAWPLFVILLGLIFTALPYLAAGLLWFIGLGGLLKNRAPVALMWAWGALGMGLLIWRIAVVTG